VLRARSELLAVEQQKREVSNLASQARSYLNFLLNRDLLTEIEAPYDVVTDALAPYFGATLKEDSLLPRDGAHLCTTSFPAWIHQSEYCGADW